MTDAFSHIFGHQKQKDFFSGIIERGTVSHAYIFCGTQGVGKALFARSVAAALLGVAPANLFRHPDVYECAIEEDSKSIGIDDVRDLISFARRTPAKGKALVLLIPNAEKLTAAAADALLKTIEDPKTPVHIFLTVVSAGQLPETVRSRAQTVFFSSLPISEMKTLFSGQASEEMLQAAAGCPGRVVAWLNNAELWEKDSKRLQVFAAMRGKSLLQKREMLSSLFLEEDMSADELISICESWHRFVDLQVENNLLTVEQAFAIHKALLGVPVGLADRIHPELLVDRVLFVV